MNAIFDLDNTLIDTERIKELFRQLAMDHGCSEEDAFKIYDKARTEDGKMVLTWKSYINELEKFLNKSLDNEKVKTIEEKLSNEDLFLSGAVELIELLKGKGLSLYLLSLGVKDWQEEKIAWAGIKKYFDDEHIIFTQNTSEGKAEVLERVFGRDFDGDDAFLFNDKPDETDKLLEAFPELIAFVRYAAKDVRYNEEDYFELTRKYPNRVFWSEDLSDLLESVKTLSEIKK